MKQIVRQTGLSRSTIYSRIKDGLFPKPLSLGGRAVGWRSDAIAQWIADRDEVDQLTAAVTAQAKSASPANAEGWEFEC